jgi:hypothetical protein
MEERPRSRRLILSRKGFDSAYGGSPSPILPDGRLVSLPIPDPHSERSYEEYRCPAGGSYLDLMKSLGLSTVRRGREVIRIGEGIGVHFDPDLCADAIERLEGWTGTLGQHGAAQGHLANQSVGAGDLFIFFGWFRQVVSGGGRLRYSGDHLHVLWGWLEVDQVTDVGRATLEPWMTAHPHAAQAELYRSNNSIYSARRHSEWIPGLPGCGVVRRYHDGLRLTAAGAASRRVWSLPSDFYREKSKLSGQSPKAWEQTVDGWRLSSACIGQEFVVEASPPIVQWVQERLGPVGRG